ncbi:hypothetical protein PISMIDRAFT_201687 [Pisolithus microcarpus 441]|uniref:Uncharacterized protein n=1 Tax=Pisolithus microcarpus 441 TaxID=765257 RepID=A0A0C9ZYA7_9AGAM|nr:hypothetical protein PISMIDRAFT_201687 [Pisolithus microcarpus 441]
MAVLLDSYDDPRYLEIYVQPEQTLPQQTNFNSVQRQSATSVLIAILSNQASKSIPSPDYPAPPLAHCKDGPRRKMEGHLGPGCA